jgi:hypothetical protein
MLPLLTLLVNAVPLLRRIVQVTVTLVTVCAQTVRESRKIERNAMVNIFIGLILL